jgi:hypothetical protein
MWPKRARGGVYWPRASTAPGWFSTCSTRAAVARDHFQGGWQRLSQTASRLGKGNMAKSVQEFGRKWACLFRWPRGHQPGRGQATHSTSQSSVRWSMGPGMVAGGPSGHHVRVPSRGTGLSPAELVAECSAGERPVPGRLAGIPFGFVGFLEFLYTVRDVARRHSGAGPGRTSIGRLASCRLAGWPVAAVR